MSPALRITAALGAGVIAAAAWSLYRNPAMGLMLDAFRLCG